MVFGQKYELQSVTYGQHDYRIIEKGVDPEEREDGDIEEYRAWRPIDNDWALVVETGTPDDVIEEIEEESKFADVLPENEANVEEVKILHSEVEKKVAFYIDEPPEQRFEELDREETIQIMERRDRWEDGFKYKDSWYHPETDEIAVQWKDGTVKAGMKLQPDDVDQEIMRGEYSLAEDDDELREQIEARAEELSEDTFYSNREAQGIVIREMGLRNQRGAEIMDEARTHVNQWVTRAKRKYKKVERSYEEVDPDIFEDRRGQHWQDKTDG